MDFLWDCALRDPPSKDRKLLIPDIDDLLPPDGSKNGNRFGEASILSTWTLPAPTLTDKDDSIAVPTLEERGRGAWDAVGGEVWEASLLLAAYLRSTQFAHQSLDNVMELGCGVALPSLLLLTLRNRDWLNVSITVSDHDECLLKNLESNILTNMNAQPTIHSTGNNLSLIIALLDWSLFDQQMDVCVLDSLLPPQLRRDQFDFIFGSALCYTTGHSCLAYLIRYYLSGRCREVVVIQIKDREGFTELMLELDKLQIQYVLDDIAEGIYEESQCISCQKSAMVEQDRDGSKQLLYYSFQTKSFVHKCEKVGLIRTDRSAFGLLRVLA